MDDTLLVQVTDPLEDLSHVEPCLGLGDYLATLLQLHHGLQHGKGTVYRWETRKEVPAVKANLWLELRRKSIRQIVGFRFLCLDVYQKSTDTNKLVKTGNNQLLRIVSIVLGDL